MRVPWGRIRCARAFRSWYVPQEPPEAPGVLVQCLATGAQKFLRPARGSFCIRGHLPGSPKYAGRAAVWRHIERGFRGSMRDTQEVWNSGPWREESLGS